MKGVIGVLAFVLGVWGSVVVTISVWKNYLSFLPPIQQFKNSEASITVGRLFWSVVSFFASFMLIIYVVTKVAYHIFNIH